MSRSRRLQPVVRHVDDLEQQALSEVAKCQNQLQVEQERLRQLQQYRLEYQSRKSHTGQTFSSFELVEFQRFICQLDETIEQQQLVLKQCELSLAKRRDQWKETRVNSQLMHKVVDNLHQQEKAKQEKLDQKELDEHSLRGHAISRQGN